jgi:branched-subunit amino acid transport protein AzlD
MWSALLLGSLGCYVLKLLGLSVPPRVLAHERVRAIADLLPVALLSALLATQTFAVGHHLEIDARGIGLLAAAVLVWRRAPFLLVVAGAVVATALVRAFA